VADILLDAHGEWDPSSTPAYALVPKDSKLMFFSENLKLFLDSDQARNDLLSAEPSQTVEGYKWAQNFTVSEVDSDDFITPAGMVRKTVTGARKLCTSDQCGNKGWHDDKVCQGIFAEADYQNANIYFVACRYVKLNEVGSDDYYAETGVNQNQVNVGYAPDIMILTEAEQDDLHAAIDDADDARDWWANNEANLADDRRDAIKRYIEHNWFEDQFVL
jgi:hypothetical protein